jgi:glucose/arabinose dehydrogenase
VVRPEAGGRRYGLPTLSRTLTLALSAALVGLSACGGSTQAPPSPPVVPVTAVTTQRVFPALTFSSPVALLQAPRDASRWFVVEQAGTVRVFANQPGVATSSVFVALPGVTSGGEAGLLGMDFHPRFPANPRVYLSYTTTVASGLQSQISELTSPDGGATLDPASERVLLRVNQPFANHNGGQVAFGPDGFLYAGYGDGGSGGDPFDNGQTLTTLLGKMLRIDVDGGTPYAIPGGATGNPFAGNPTCGDTGSGSSSCPEIFAWGFRNPWRWSFDRQTGQLWVGDVGQDAWEEIDVVVRGADYGWRFREGAHCYDPATGCPTAGLVDPVSEYDHSQGSAVTGGYVYRGSAMPGLVGRYVFGDFGSGRIWRADPGSLTPVPLATTSHAISSFAEGNDGELYVVDYAGTLHVIRAVAAP